MPSGGCERVGLSGNDRALHAAGRREAPRARGRRLTPELARRRRPRRWSASLPRAHAAGGRRRYPFQGRCDGGIHGTGSTVRRGALELRDELADELHWLCLGVGCCLTGSISCVPRRCVACGTVSPPGGAVVAEPDYRSIAGRSGNFSGCGDADTCAGSASPLARIAACPVARDRRDPSATHSTKDVENDVSMRRQIAWARLQAVQLEISRRFDEGVR